LVCCTKKNLATLVRIHTVLSPKNGEKLAISTQIPVIYAEKEDRNILFQENSQYF
jgi:hypothetical protein